MGLFDALFVSLTGILLGAAWFAGRRAALWALGAAALALAAQLQVEGYRWQMLPAYLACALAGFQLLRATSGRPFGGITFAALALLLSLSTFISIALPVFRIPEPSGPHPIGTTARLLVDHDRLETHTRDPDDHRRLEVRLWYPARKTDSAPAGYWPDDSTRDGLVVRGLGLPEGFGFLFSHVARVRTHSVEGAEVAEGRHRVLLFSHGMAFGFSRQNTVLMEHLASHGYIVAAIDHAFWGLYTKFPDDRIATSSAVQNRFQALWRDAASLGDLDDQLLQSDLPIDRLETVMREVLERQPEVARAMGDGIALWSADQSFVMDAIERLNRDDPLLRGHIDAAGFGVMGMSLGGTTSIHTCVGDARCKAAVNIDGFQPISILLPPLRVASMHFANDNLSWSRYSHLRSSAESYHVRISNTQHANYSDFALMTPLLRGTRILGEIDGLHAIEITNRYIEAFFDKALMGQRPPLLEPGAAPSDAQVDRR